MEEMWKSGHDTLQAGSLGERNLNGNTPIDNPFLDLIMLNEVCGRNNFNWNYLILFSKHYWIIIIFFKPFVQKETKERILYRECGYQT